MANKTNFETIIIDDFIHDPINQTKVQSYPPELVGRFNSFIVTAFDDSMTVEMQIRTLIKWIKENIDVTMSALDNMEAFKLDSMAFQNHVKNTLVNLINQFTDQFDDNLKAETLAILTKWFDDGVLSDIVRNAINEEVINARGGKETLGQRLDETDDQLFNINEEVLNARGGKDTLGQRLDDTDSQLGQIETNVKRFGALGDGETDDTQAILDALAYLKGQGGGVLYFPTGTYMTAPIDLTTFTSIKFRGYNEENNKQPWLNQSVIKFNVAGDYGIKITDPVEDPKIYGKNIVIDGFFIECNNMVDYGINMNYLVTVKNTCIRRAKLDGIVFEGRTYPVTLDSVYSQYNGRHGLHVKAPNTTVYKIIDSEFGYNDGYGMYIEDGNTSLFSNVLCQSNKTGGLKIKKPNADDYSLPIWLSKLTFINLYFEANGTLQKNHPNYDGNYALKIEGRSTDVLSYGGKIEDLVFINANINKSNIGETSNIAGTLNLVNINSRGLNIDPLKNIVVSPVRELVANVRNLPELADPYQEIIIRNSTQNLKVGNGYIGNRGKYRQLKYFLNEITPGETVTLETLSSLINNGLKGYPISQSGSVMEITVHLQKANTTIKTGSIRFELWQGFTIYNTYNTNKNIHFPNIEMTASDNFLKSIRPNFLSVQLPSNSIFSIKAIASEDLTWSFDGVCPPIEVTLLIEN